MTPRARKAAQQREAQRQCEAYAKTRHEAGHYNAVTIAAIESARSGSGMTKTSLDEIRAMSRIGPGPNRPEMHEHR